jgi:hypothetical protein
MMNRYAIVMLSICLLSGCVIPPDVDVPPIPETIRLTNLAEMGEGVYKCMFRVTPPDDGMWLATFDQQENKMNLFGLFNFVRYDSGTEVMSLERNGTVIELPKGQTVRWVEAPSRSPHNKTPGHIR